MNKPSLSWRQAVKPGVLFKVLLMLVLIVLLAQPVMAKGGNPGVAPPNSTIYGQSYGDWAAAGWQYVVGFPAATNPLNDPEGTNCADGQSGPVFFLVGTSGGAAERDECVAPVGKSIFFPAMNFFCAAPEDGTVEEMVALCSWATDLITDVQVTVDGMPVEGLKEDYRFPSPVFPFDGAIDNPYDTFCGGVPSGTCYEGAHTAGFSDGYWIMLRPLSVGQHTIHMFGYLADWDFMVDVTYNLTVANPAP
jgi:hypothetical protein